MLREVKDIPAIKLTSDDIKYMALFESLTGAAARDCIIDLKENRIIFMVNHEDMGIAIGKGGVNIRRLEKILRKSIEIMAYTEVAESFIKNCLAPANIKAVKITKSIDGRKIAVVTVEPREKGLAIGRGGRNIEKARLLSKRYFDIDNVVIA